MSDPRLRMSQLFAAFGPPGEQPVTREEARAVMTLVRRIVNSIPIAGAPDSAERQVWRIMGAEQVEWQTVWRDATVARDDS